MFKLFKTKDERDLAFVSKMWERPKNVALLREILAQHQTPFELAVHLGDKNLMQSFRYVRYGHKYQILYLVVDYEGQLKLSTTFIGYPSWFPISVIFSEYFPREGTLRKRMNMLAARYLVEFNDVLSVVSPLRLKISHTYFGDVFLTFDYKED